MQKIMLMGDSITEYMPYIFKGSIGNSVDEVKYVGIENIGVGYYVNYVWPRIKNEAIDTYVLLIGINNILRPDCDDDGKESLDDLIDKLKGLIIQIVNNGSSRLIVQSIYPTKYFEANEKIVYVNKNIKIFCDKMGIEYLDLYSLLRDEDGLFNKRYSDDGIHPNDNGYSIVAQEINKQLKITFSKKLSLEKNVF
ncbi:MAG: SGNH/GDSL hydrolase family protein [Bacilli bacterium]|nr:SGNH/GDSL hydrolase family protein [Bacilli bacterium]